MKGRGQIFKNKLLDGARKEVADLQQQLDNFQQKTRALSSARAQDWAARLARVDRTYQVGFLAANPMEMFAQTAAAQVVAPEADVDAAAGEGETPEGETPEGETPEGETP